VQKLRILRELLVVHDRDRWPSLPFDLGQRLTGTRGREHLAVRVGPIPRAWTPETEAQPGIAQRLAHHRLELIKRWASQRVADQPAQRTPGEQLRGDQREQKPVPNRRPACRDRPLDEAAQRIQVPGIAASEQLLHLVGRFDQQVAHGDRCTNCERSSPRGRAGHESPDQQPCRTEQHGNPSHARDVD
jgi:hypothetical protein